MGTKFQGQPFVQVVAILPGPKIGLLKGKPIEEFLKEYEGRVERDYENNNNLRVLSSVGSLAVGANPFTVVLTNQILREENLRTATQADLEMVPRSSALSLRGMYLDTGLVLRSETEPNGYLARDLTKQLRSKGLSFEYPFLLNLTDLTLRPDQDSNYGLSFNLRDNVKPIYAPIINSLNGSKFSSTDIDAKTGLPRRVGTEGDRTLYTRDFGLSRLCLGRYVVLYSGDDDLAFSYSGGRVVVVSDE